MFARVRGCCGLETANGPQRRAKRDRKRTAAVRECRSVSVPEATQRMLHSCGACAWVPSDVEQIGGGQRPRVGGAFDQTFRLVEYKYVELGSFD